MRLIRCLPLLILVLVTAPAEAATSWSDAGQLAGSYSGHTATRLPDGSVLAAGGNDLAPAVERFDPATSTWSATGSLSLPRLNHTATLLSNGKVLVAGGHTVGTVATTEVYDPATGIWTAGASMGVGRSGHVAALLPNGKVLVAGGFTATAEVYDPAANTWAPAAPMSVARTHPSAAVLEDGDVLVAAGGHASAERYDAASDTWTSTGPIALPRTLTSAARLPDGSVLLAGGNINPSRQALVERYDPATNTWSLAPPLREARIAALTALPDGRVLAVGDLPSAELFDPATNRWTATDPPDATRFRPTATLLADGSVLVLGGTGVKHAERYRHASMLTVAAAYFGDRVVGASGAPAVVPVRNAGSQRLIVTGVTLSGQGAADFSVTADGCTGTVVAPGDSCRVAVAFRPTAAGAREAELRIVSDTGDAEVSTLAGTGLAAPVVGSPEPPTASASCARHSARAARCRFSLPGVKGWSDVKVALKRGKRTRASGRVLAWRGRGSLKLRGGRALARGGYRLVLRARGRTAVTLPVSLR